MKKRWYAGLMLAGLVGGFQVKGAATATEILEYTPGTGFATEFGTGLGYTNAQAALGEPARETPGTWGGPITPFSPPYTRDQLLSIGVGGSLTLRLGEPIRDAAGNPYGVDFLIFTGLGFVITNGDYTGGGITDGTRFGTHDAGVRVLVSGDGETFYELSPSLAPRIEDGFPTDGGGDFTRPADPALLPADFGGRNLDGIRELYQGSAGGTGYDLAWAMVDGQPVGLTEASFVRLEVLSGRADIDGIVVVPEPAAWVLLVIGAACLGVGKFKFSRKDRHARIP